VEGLTDVMEIDEASTIGNGESMRTTKVGNLKCEVIQVNGKKFPLTLHDVKFVPDLCVNLFSLNRALQNGFNLSNENVSIRLSKGSVTLIYDRVIKTINGFVTGINMKTLTPKAIHNGMVNTTISEAYGISYLHKAFGHCGLETLKNTARMYGSRFTGQFEFCEDCAIEKARHKNINKVWSGSSNIPGERLYVNISAIQERSFGGSKFWALVVDDFMDYCWSFVLKNKSDLKGKIKPLLTDFKIAGIDVKYIRCDNAGENKAMKDDPEIKPFGIKFEFYGPRTHQRNGKVERKFQTFYGRIRSMLNCAGLKDELRNKIWAESAMMVTYLSNVMSTKHELKSPQELLFGSKPVLNSRLKVFGEVGVVTTKDKIQAKLTNCGTTCIFVGYAKNRSKDVLRMLNLETKAIIHSRDIIWLHKMHKD
jgi:hypothetical protein